MPTKTATTKAKRAVDRANEPVEEMPPIEKDADYVGRRVYNEGGTEAGVVTSYYGCTLGGCRGMRLCVTWPDGGRTRPCTKGCTFLGNGHLRIG